LGEDREFRAGGMGKETGVGGGDKQIKIHLCAVMNTHTMQLIGKALNNNVDSL